MGRGPGASQPPPGPPGGQRGRWARRSLLCLPGCSSPTPTGSHSGSGISYLLRSQILRGEKCPQQAVPVTKELPNKRRAESGRACQNLWWGRRHSRRCSARSPGITEWSQDKRRGLGRGVSEKLQEDDWKCREVYNPPGTPTGERTGELAAQKGPVVSARQNTTSLHVQPSGQGRAGLSGCRKGPPGTGCWGGEEEALVRGQGGWGALLKAVRAR